VPALRKQAAQSPDPRRVRLWLDAQISPRVGTWIEASFEVESLIAVQSDPELRALPDETIFALARSQSAIVVTKDRDFVEMVERMGTPPRVIWLTCGNTSNAVLREILAEALPNAFKLLAEGEPLVEITDL